MEKPGIFGVRSEAGMASDNPGRARTHKRAGEYPAGRIVATKSKVL